MNDQDIIKLVNKLSESFVTKEDLRDLATKEDVNELRDDINGLKSDVGGLRGDIRRLENKIDEVDQKASTILEFAEAVDETTVGLNKRVTKIESIPAIAHELTKPKS